MRQPGENRIAARERFFALLLRSLNGKVARRGDRPHASVDAATLCANGPRRLDRPRLTLRNTRSRSLWEELP